MKSPFVNKQCVSMSVRVRSCVCLCVCVRTHKRVCDDPTDGESGIRSLHCGRWFHNHVCVCACALYYLYAQMSIEKGHVQPWGGSHICTHLGAGRLGGCILGWITGV